MGDGPNIGAGDGGATGGRRPGDFQWVEEPQTNSTRYKTDAQGRYLGPNNKLDQAHDPGYPDEPAQGFPMTKDQRYLAVPSLQYGLDGKSKIEDSETVVQPGSVYGLKVLPEKTTGETPLPVGDFPTPAQVHAETGRFWNNNVNLAQLAWNGYKLYPHGPWPSVPPMFPVFKDLKPNLTSLKESGEALHANLKNLTAKKTVEPFGKKFAPLGIAGGTFLAEVGIDAVFQLDKNEYQTGRIIADIYGPAVAMSSSPHLNTWWKKAIVIVGTHFLGRLADKFTETPMRKWNTPGDE